MGMPKAGGFQTVHINYLTEKLEDLKCVIRSRKSEDTMAKRKK